LSPKLIITTFTSHLSQKEFSQLFNHLKDLSRDSNIIVSGSQLDNFDLDNSQNISRINTTEELEALLKSLK